MDLLPDEIIDMSIKRLVSPEDIVRCSAVCKKWQFIVAEIRKKQPQKVLRFTPWLMFAPLHYDCKDEEKPLEFFDFRNNKLVNKLLMFFNFSNDKLVNKPLKFFNFRNNKLVNMGLPNTEGRIYWGSRFGWILTLELCGLNVYILNPISKMQLSLPSILDIKYDIWVARFCSDFVCKLVLSSYSSDFSMQVMAIYGEKSRHRLAFAKPGDEIWTSISSPENWITYTDAIFFKSFLCCYESR